MLYTSSDFTFDSALDTQSKLKIFIKSINFDDIEPDHLIELKPILDQAADIDLYSKYIMSILNKNDKTLKPILLETWNQLGSNVLKLPIFIHEKCIEVNPGIFEKTILSTLLSWQTENLFIMCAKSPLVFRTCSSIFNELLIKLHFSEKFMVFLINFVNNVITQCENYNFDVIDIYPSKCRSILTIRTIINTNSCLISKQCLSKEVKQLALKNPKECVCLLSHFPDLYEPI